jgi:hypothetical protein
MNSGEKSWVCLASISDIAEENASVYSVVGFGDIQKYSSCFLFL